MLSESITESSTQTHALPLAHLRRRPGRPRKHPLETLSSDKPGDSGRRQERQAAVVAELLAHGPQAKLTFAPPERPGITARRLYSRRQAAEYLGCSIDTVDRLAASGELPRLYLPGSRLLRFDLLDLELIVAEARSN
jgi:excisionase family DNA binding protein